MKRQFQEITSQPPVKIKIDIVLLFSCLTLCLAQDGCSITSSSVDCVEQSGRFLPVETSSVISSLYIIRSDLSALTEEDLIPFKDVDTVSIINSTLLLPQQDSLLSTMSDLSVLRIVHCNMSEDVSAVFADNAQISQLYLSNNKISSIKKEFFASMKYVEKIDLSHNKIRSIEVRTFDGLTFLRVLNLTNNYIGVSFDPNFLRLQSTLCVVCRMRIGDAKCTKDDFNRCKGNEQEDQFWWISVQVTVHLEENPICGIFTGKELRRNVEKSSMDTELRDQHSCKVYDQGHCFKHESRKMFFLEACGFTKMPPTNLANEIVAERVDNSILWYGIAVGIIVTVVVAATIKKGIKVFVKKGINAGKHTSQVQQSELDSLVKKNDTRLHDAVKYNNLSKVKRLLTTGSDPSVEDEHGDLPLNYAARLGYNDIIDVLVNKRVDINAKNTHGDSAIHSAIRRGHYDTVKLLLKHGANLNVENKLGHTPLSLACEQGHHDIARLLMDHGASIDRANASGITSAHVAASIGSSKIIKLLVERGADIHRVDRRGFTPLLYASRDGHLEIVKLLLDEGASVTVINYCNNTPLHEAAKEGHLGVIKLLLERNADATTTNYRAQKPHDVAAEQGHHDCARYLVDHSVQYATEGIYYNHRRGILMQGPPLEEERSQD